jgi:hypothetical protein
MALTARGRAGITLRLPILLSALSCLIACDASVVPPDDRATIGVSPRAITLTTVARTPQVVTATVDLFNNSDFGSLAGLQATIGDAAAAAWLTVTEVSDSSLSLEATAQGLNEGVYDAEVMLALEYATNSPRSIAVTLIATAGPEILLPSDTVQFHHLPGDSGRVFVKTMAFDNGGGGQLTGLTLGPIAYDPRDPYQGWLSVGLTADPPTLEFTVVYGFRTDCRPDTSPMSRLAGFLCSAEFQISSPVAGNSPKTVSVFMTFDNEPTIFLSPKGLAFAATEGGPSPASQTAVLSGTGIIDVPPLDSYQLGQPLDLTGAVAQWVSTSLQDSTIRVDVNSAGLSSGIYLADVEVTHPPVLTRGLVRPVLPDTLKLSLTVDPPPPLPPSIELTATSITVSSTRVETVGITNGGDGVLTGLSVSGPDWLLAFLDSNAAPASLTVSLHPAISPPSGVTAGELTISAREASSVVLTVNVSQ